MTLTISKNVLLAVILLALAWGGAAAIAYALGARAQGNIGDYANCEQAAWREWRREVSKYDTGSQNEAAYAQYSAAYNGYTAEHLRCSEHYLD